MSERRGDPLLLSEDYAEQQATRGERTLSKSFYGYNDWNLHMKLGRIVGASPWGPIGACHLAFLIGIPLFSPMDDLY